MYLDRTYCDFLIFAPLELEIKAMVKALEDAGGQKCSSRKDIGLRVIELNLGNAGYSKRIVVAMLKDQGVMNAGIDTAKTLQFYEPACVISFGIAGSFSEEDAPIGSVVFATSLFYYEPAKYISKEVSIEKGGEEKLEQRAQVENAMLPVNISESLLKIFRGKADKKHRFGPFASGEKLFADIHAFDRKRIVGVNRHVLGVDMEAAGVGQAVKYHHPASDFYVVKGISDMADREKNSISPELQNKNRKRAAKNAATSVVTLIQAAPPLSDVMRPRIQTTTQKTARSETKKIIEALEPHGIQINERELYRVLLGRRYPIPAYYHWKQHSEGLNWIDFKILYAIASLPSDIVEPVPLVTDEYRKKNASWNQTVQSMLRSTGPITRDSFENKLSDLCTIARARGLDEATGNIIIKNINETSDMTTAIATQNWMQYMLGQNQSRRLLLFSWKDTSQKWNGLTWAFDALFAMFTWNTLTLSGFSKKNEPPNSDICIDADFTSLQRWLDSEPRLETLCEFINHLRTKEHAAAIQNRLDAVKELEKLKSLWKEKFFSSQ